MRWTSLLGALTFPWRRAALALLLAGLAMNLALPSAGAAFIFPPPPPDLEPDIRITDVTLSESTSGTVTARFSVRLGGFIFQPVTVGFQTADGTAKVADGDYNAASGSVTFQPSSFENQTRTISVTVKADTVAELDETFFVNLSLISAAPDVLLLDGQGKGTIRGNNNGSGGSGDYCDRNPDDPRCTPIQN